MSTQPFNSDGGFTTPGNINFANNAAIQLTPVTGVTIYGNSIDQATALTLDNSGDAALWANANVTINSDSQGSNPQWIFGADGNLTTPGAGGDITGANLIATGTLSATGNVVANAFVGTNGNVDLIAGSYTWTFDTNGNIDLPGGYSSLGISNSGYTTTLKNDSTYVAVDGDNGVVNIVTNGGGTEYTFVDNFNATSSANVLSLTTRNGDSNPVNSKPQIVFGYNGTTDYPQFVHTIHNAGTSVNNRIEFWTSDGAQVGTFPANAILGGTITQGAMQLAVYADATARDAVITSPTPGMMIYVTGVGMQVRGATSWNTIAGSGS